MVKSSMLRVAKYVKTTTITLIALAAITTEALITALMATKAMVQLAMVPMATMAAFTTIHLAAVLTPLLASSQTT